MVRHDLSKNCSKLLVGEERKRSGHISFIVHAVLGFVGGSPSLAALGLHAQDIPGFEITYRPGPCRRHSCPGSLQCIRIMLASILSPLSPPSLLRPKSVGSDLKHYTTSYEDTSARSCIVYVLMEW